MFSLPMSIYDLLIKFPLQLFIVLTPIAAVAALIGVTPNISSAKRTKISIEASLIAFGILAVAATCGPLIFSVFNITNESFQIAGGIYLILIGLDMLSAKGNDDIGEDERISKQNVAITPLAMPLLAGPGTISYIFLTRSKISTGPELFLFFAGIFIAMAAVAACFIAAARASNSIPNNIVKLGEKLTGLMIICIGVQTLTAGIHKAYEPPKQGTNYAAVSSQQKGDALYYTYESENGIEFDHERSLSQNI